MRIVLVVLCLCAIVVYMATYADTKPNSKGKEKEKLFKYASPEVVERIIDKFVNGRVLEKARELMKEYIEMRDAGLNETTSK